MGSQQRAGWARVWAMAIVVALVLSVAGRAPAATAAGAGTAPTVVTATGGAAHTTQARVPGTGDDVNHKTCAGIGKFFNFTAGGTFGLMGTIIGGPTGILTAFVGAMLAFQFASKCVLLSDPNAPGPKLTIAFLMDELERVAGERLDRAVRTSIELRAADLLQTLDHERPNLERVDELTTAERQRLATVMQTLGNAASQMEAEIRQLTWQSLPAVAFVASLKNGAYALSYALSDDGAYRRNFEEVLIPQERHESIRLIAKLEADLVRFTRDQLTLTRTSSKRTSPGRLVPTTWFEIEATATRGREQIYHQSWECERRWRPNHQCTSYERLRSEYLAAALDSHRDARTRILSALTSDYLAIKNKLMAYAGTQFLLVNNRVDNSGSLPGPNKCLDVSDEVAPAQGVGLWLSGCEDAAADGPHPSTTDQLWRFVPGTGQVQNVRLGLCMDVADASEAPADGSSVVLATCSAGDVPEQADQDWGMHPLGYLVNLASGLCLDLDGTGTSPDRVGTQLSECRYDRSAGTVDAQGRLARGASKGALAADLVTNQTWTMRYRGAILPSELPAAPPETIPDLPPTAVDDNITVAQDSPAVEVAALANDTDLDGGRKRVEAVSKPARGTTVIVHGGTEVTYRPDAGYCEEPGGSPDEFTYRLNGGSTGTVQVTVACTPDVLPTAVDDALVVLEGSAATVVDVLTNDTDPDGGPRAVVALTQPEHGRAEIVAGTAVSYQPPAGYCTALGAAPDEFSYTVTGGSSARVSVQVSCLDTTAPRTRIVSGPGAKRTDRDAVRFTFSSTAARATFVCSVDGAPFAACVSPYTNAPLPVGPHTFAVRSISPAGIPDPKGAIVKWRVRKCVFPAPVAGCRF